MVGFEKMFKTYGMIFAKILLSCLALWWVFRKVDYGHLFALFWQVDWCWLMVSFLVFNMSRWIAAYRLNLFFDQIGLSLSQVFNLKLYYLGMFYNFLLPGGISGDGYKVYFLNKHYQVGAMDLVYATLVDRVTGLFSLCWLLVMVAGYATCAVWLPIPTGWYLGVMLLLWPIFYGVYSLVARRFLSLFFWSNVWAFFMQLSQVFVVICLLQALHEPLHMADYVFAFLISSMVSVFPFSFGGIGARELTFMYLQPWLGYDVHTGIMVSALFFLLTLLSSFPGIFFLALCPD